MSELPAEQTCSARPTSAVSCQLRTHAAQQTMCSVARLLDHLVGGGKQGWRNLEVERPRCLEVDGQVILDWCFHRQICGFGAFQDTIDIRSRTPKDVVNIGPVRHQAAFRDE